MRTYRKYQIDAGDAAIDTLTRHPSAIIVLPTGTGKTIVISYIASSWKGANILFLAHRIEILDQMADKLAVELGARPSVEQGMRGADADLLYSGGMHLVASIQTLRNDKRLRKFERTPFDLIIVDECHRAVAPSYAKVFDYFTKLNPNCKILGLTATPNRTDETALGLVFQQVAYEMPILDAIYAGWLVPIRQEFVVVSDLKFTGLKVSKNEMGESDFSPEELEKMLMEDGPLIKMARPTFDIADGRPCIVFSAGVRHAHALARVLNSFLPGCAAAVDGETPKEERDRVVKMFRQGELQFLCNCQIFTEGADFPRCAMVSNCAPGKSVLTYTQKAGRALRPLDGIVDGYECDEDRKMAILRSDKPFATILDFRPETPDLLASTIDILGGNYDIEIRQLAEEKVRQGMLPVEALDESKEDIELEREQKTRNAIRRSAQVEYERHLRDESMHAATAASEEFPRGGSTDGQIKCLVGLGVSWETAAGYSKRQAAAVIQKIGSTKCTIKQQELLKRFGYNSNVGMDEATEIINRIAISGWTLRGDVPEGS